MEALTKGRVEEAYTRYFPVILEKCRRILRDPAEAQDVAQETFTTLWEKRHTIRDPDALVAWVYRTSTRLAVSRIRKQRRTVLSDDECEDSPTTDSSVPSTNPESATITRLSLRRLAKIARGRELEAAILTHVDGLTHDEARVVMEMSDRSIRRLLAKLDERVARAFPRGLT